MRYIFPGGKLLWRHDPLDQAQLLLELSDEHRKWVQDIAREFKEIPIGYTEWTLTGQLAIAADKLGHYALQEYYIQPKARPNEVPKRLRPDLYVKVDDEHDYVFEVKQSGIDFDDHGSVIERKLVENLHRARNKTYDYKGEALYRCSLVIAPIWMEIDDWAKYCVSSSYHQGVAKLRENLRCVFNSLPLSLANFCGGFVCSCQEANEEHDRAREEKRSPFPVGVAYMGRMKPPGRPGR